jgi:hypothetical protein
MHDLLLSNLKKLPSVYFELTIIQLLFLKQIVLKNQPIDVCPCQESGSNLPPMHRGPQPPSEEAILNQNCETKNLF